MENAYETYQEMLAEIGIHQELTPQIPETEKVQEKYEPTCCSGDPNDIVIHDGAHICWHCGNTVSYKVLVYYNPYHCSGKPVGWNNTVSFERKRGYKVGLKLVFVNKAEFDPFQRTFAQIYGRQVHGIPQESFEAIEPAS